MYPLHAINLNILKVKGRSDLFLKLEIIKSFISIGMVFVSVRHGLTALLIGQLFGSILCYVPNSFYSNKMIAYSIREQAFDALPSFVLAGVTGLVAALVSRGLSGYPPVMAVACSGLAATVFFWVQVFVYACRGPSFCVTFYWLRGGE